MPWNGEVQLLAGNVSRRCERHGFLCPSSTHEAESHRARKDFELRLSVERPDGQSIELGMQQFAFGPGIRTMRNRVNLSEFSYVRARRLHASNRHSGEEPSWGQLV